MPADRKTAQRLFTKFDKAIKQVAKEAEADHVHHLRTNARRIEALLSSEKIGANGKLLKQLKRYRKRAGKVRDLDVQIAALKSLQIEGHYEHKQAVLSALQRQRSKRAKKLIMLVDDSQQDSRKRLQKVKGKVLDHVGGAAPRVDFYQAALDIFRKAAGDLEAN